jgi:hypothetical protein
LDASGLAPSRRRYEVRSRSGTGWLTIVPNISALEISFGR